MSWGINLECQTVCDSPSRKRFRVWGVVSVDVFFLLVLIAPSDLELLSFGSSPTMSNFIHNAHLRDFQPVVLCTRNL